MYRLDSQRKNNSVIIKGLQLIFAQVQKTNPSLHQKNLNQKGLIVVIRKLFKTLIVSHSFDSSITD
ncbi:hypothetical protein BDA99DRAFT_528987 [Phascolomyces articulosus]|uniref:Uncharacterized protein n=1 Tax=Phascolomyces articulosus TaxID=60185 RepID=A0AAD5P773_9FUNG|nr:hypothetical protein BDA99DRAFT_528987 [Phascolomyces articulosus]